MNPREGARDEYGAATVLALAMAGVLLLVGAALGVVAALLVAHRSAQAAADLAALAGASTLTQGDSCGEAARVAAANRATLTTCSVTARGDVLVSVEVSGPKWLGQTHDLVASARAGPVTE